VARTAAEIAGCYDPHMNWQQLQSDKFQTFRAAVPGGWLVVVLFPATSSPSVTFYPDANHKWDGKSLPVPA
jgi:hypothetical protein